MLALNAGENKYNKNGKFLKGGCNKCGKYVHRATYYWVGLNKGIDNRNNNKNNRKHRFGGECKNCGKRRKRGGWLLGEKSKRER